MPYHCYTSMYMNKMMPHFQFRAEGILSGYYILIIGVKPTTATEAVSRWQLCTKIIRELNYRMQYNTIQYYTIQ